MDNRIRCTMIVEASEKLAGMLTADTPEELRTAILKAKYEAWTALNERDAFDREVSKVK